MLQEDVMEKSTKKQINLRLKDTVINELKHLTRRHKASQADIVAILIHWLYTDGEDVEKLDEALNTADIL